MSNDSLKFWQPNDATINLNLKGLVGTKLTVVRGDGTMVDAICAGADPYIGLSLVRADDHTKIVDCFHGPFDPNFREKYLYKKTWQNDYHSVFTVFLQFIKEAKKTGFLYRKELNKAISKAKGVPSKPSYGGVCPFGV